MGTKKPKKQSQPKEWRWDKLEKLTNFGHKKEFRKEICKLVGPGDWAEFGVYEGESANIFLKYGLKPNERLFLFDSWEGLPDDWTGHSGRLGPINKGAMKCLMPTFKDDRVRIVKGWFEETLPEWVASYDKQSLALIHIDCDIYSSTKTILKYIHPLISEDTLIIFDEYCGYASWKEHEYKAFKEYVTEYDKEVRYIARSVTMAQVALKIQEY